MVSSKTHVQRGHQYADGTGRLLLITRTLDGGGGETGGGGGGGPFVLF